jgi:hypothetical protein
MEFSAEYQRLYDLVLRAGDRSAGAAEVATEILSIATDIDATDLTPEEAKVIRFMSSSVMLNCAFDLQDTTLLERGRKLAEQALAETDQSEPLHFQCLYNVANAIVAECDRGLPTMVGRDVWVPRLIENRLAHRVRLREARTLFFEAASSQCHVEQRDRVAGKPGLAGSGGWL